MKRRAFIAAFFAALAIQMLGGAITDIWHMDSATTFMIGGWCGIFGLRLLQLADSASEVRNG